MLCSRGLLSLLSEATDGQGQGERGGPKPAWRRGQPWSPPPTGNTLPVM